MIILESSGDAVCDPLTLVTPYYVMSDHKLKQKHNSVKNYCYLSKTWNTNHVTAYKSFINLSEVILQHI